MLNKLIISLSIIFSAFPLWAQTPTPTILKVVPEWRYIPQGQANWTSGTAIDTSYLMLKNEPLNSCILVGVLQSGDVDGAAVTFEASLDGARYVPILATDPLGVVQPNPFPMQSNRYSVLKFDGSGFRYFHARLNPAIPGSGTISFGYMLEAWGCP